MSVCSTGQDAGAAAADLAVASPSPGSGSSSGGAGLEPQLSSQLRWWRYQLQWLLLGYVAYCLSIYVTCTLQLHIVWLALRAESAVLTGLLGLTRLASSALDISDPWLMAPLAPLLRAMLLPTRHIFVAAPKAVKVIVFFLLSAGVVGALRWLADRGGRWRYVANALAAAYFAIFALIVGHVAFPALVNNGFWWKAYSRGWLVGMLVLFLAWWHERLRYAGEEVHLLFGRLLPRLPFQPVGRVGVRAGWL